MIYMLFTIFVYPLPTPMCCGSYAIKWLPPLPPMPMNLKKVVLFPQEQFECHNKDAPALRKMSHCIMEKCDIFRRGR